MQKLLALAGLETPFDKQEAPLEQATDLVLNGFAFTSQAAGYFIFGRRSPALQLRFRLGQAVAFGCDGAQDTLGEFLQDMERTNLMRHLAKHGANRLRIERGTIGGDALEEQVPVRQRPLQANALRATDDSICPHRR